MSKADCSLMFIVLLLTQPSYIIHTRIPAKLIPTLSACHMITTSILLDWNLASRAVLSQTPLTQMVQ